MEEKKFVFSKTSVDMLKEIVDKMREFHIDLINIYLLLYGIISSRTEDGKQSILLDYISENTGITSGYVEAITETVALSSKPSLLNRFAKILSSSSFIKKEKSSNSATKVVFYFTDTNGEEYEIPLDDESAIVLAKVVEFATNNSINDEIQPIHLVIAMFETESITFKEFLTDFGVNYYKAKKFFKLENIDKENFIPFSLSNFLSLYNDKIDTTKPCQILSRDEEVKKLWSIMLKVNKKNAVIVGDPGVGKSAIMEKIAYEIISGTCPDEFQNYKVVCLDVNSFSSGTINVGESENRIKSLIEFLKDTNDIILFIDDIHTLFSSTTLMRGETQLSNALRLILSQGDTIVIGTTTTYEYELEMYFSQNSILSKYFEKINVSEPSPEDVYPMIKNKINTLSEIHGVEITQEMVEFIVMIAGCFANNDSNPYRTLNLIDHSMVSAKTNRKKIVDKDCVLENFDIFFKMWDNMNEDSKKEIAYHETGHYIMFKASDKLIEYNMQAVSIMPAEGYLGVTVYNIDSDVVPFSNIDYYIDLIAADLAGRVAESFFRKTFTSGASADLDAATRTAFIVVTKLGMGNESIENRIYLNSENYPMFSEKSTNVINDEVNKLIKKAFDRATIVLEENRDILEAIVKNLLEKKIMSEVELDKVWQDVVSKRR